MSWKRLCAIFQSAILAKASGTVAGGMLKAHLQIFLAKEKSSIKFE